MISTRYLIVGGGQTGDAAVKGIRERDPEGSIVLVGGEQHAPYARPPLTKKLWAGGDEAKIWRATADAGVDFGWAAGSCRSTSRRGRPLTTRARRTRGRSCSSRPAAGRA